MENAQHTPLERAIAKVNCGPRYVIQDQETKHFVACELHRECAGEFSDTLSGAAYFPTFAAAADFSQNYGPECVVVSTHDVETAKARGQS